MTTFAPCHETTSSEFRLSEILSALSYALDITEGQPEGHAVRTCLIGMRIAQGAALPSADRGPLFYSLLLKDLGCSSNAARLCTEMTQTRCDRGAEIASLLGFTAATQEAIRSLSRALVVADIGEALTADRPYRAGLPWEQVLGILRKEAGVGVCSERVEALAASRG